jgi:hypothetical protein
VEQIDAPGGHHPTDHDFVAQEQELQSNTELTRAIHALTTAIHRQVVGSGEMHPTT